MQADSEVVNRLNSTLQKVQEARLEHGIKYPVTLVAASKTKSTEEIMQAYQAGQRHFGENYVDEI